MCFFLSSNTAQLLLLYCAYVDSAPIFTPKSLHDRLAYQASLLKKDPMKSSDKVPIEYTEIATLGTKWGNEMDVVLLLMADAEDNEELMNVFYKEAWEHLTSDKENNAFLASYRRHFCSAAGQSKIIVTHSLVAA